MSPSWHHRPLLGGNFRQLIQAKDIDGCKVLKLVLDNSVLAPFVKFLQASAPGFIHDCPYGPGMEKAENITFHPDKNPGIANLRSIMKLPSGEYKIEFKITTTNDDNVVSAAIFYIINERKQALEGDMKF